MIDAPDEDYIRTARAMGLTRRAIIWKFALKNAALPVVTVLGLQAGRLLGGAVDHRGGLRAAGLRIACLQRRVPAGHPGHSRCLVISAIVILSVDLLPPH